MSISTLDLELGRINDLPYGHCREQAYALIRASVFTSVHRLRELQAEEAVAEGYHGVRINTVAADLQLMRHEIAAVSLAFHSAVPSSRQAKRLSGLAQ
uniref:Uncharacterized protein n=1 Tax=Peronospora matthiolae TaxID=2874970 RepID=A0AAV1TTE0_9STRA